MDRLDLAMIPCLLFALEPKLVIWKQVSFLYEYLEQSGNSY